MKGGKDYKFKILRIEQAGDGLKVTMQYNEGVEGYRFLDEEASVRFMCGFNSMLEELKHVRGM